MTMTKFLMPSRKDEGYLMERIVDFLPGLVIGGVREKHRDV